MDIYHTVQTPKGYLHIDKEGQFYLGGDRSVNLALFTGQAEARDAINRARKQFQERMKGNSPNSYKIVRARIID